MIDDPVDRDAADPEPGRRADRSLVRLLAEELTRRGSEVWVLTPAVEAHDWPDGVSVQIGEVTDPAAFAVAVSGAQRVFLAGLVGESLDPLRDLTNALITAGSGRVVALGSHGSDFQDEISGETWQWPAFERSLDKHGIGWAYLRPTALMAHTLVGGYPIPGSVAVQSIRTRKPVYEYLPDAPDAFIHEQDSNRIRHSGAAVGR
ncbi:NAD(P)H-binding protein [Nocardia carnea]|uniref:NAD(P)H-binding protein n=1 Tax=Nocardia carnea TaxID=37328 RepID=UPI002457CBCD|nr:NAD(P)H-binding protein [Nocardia carnea]